MIRSISTLTLFCQLSLGQAQPNTSFFAIHCDPYESGLFTQLEQMVDSATSHNVPLTLMFAPQWVNSILADTSKFNTVRNWQAWGHEIAAHHHGIYHCAWDSLTNNDASTVNAIRTDTAWVPGNCDLGIQQGVMQPFWDSLEVLAGDSLLLTWQSSDEYPAVDMYPSAIYRAYGGRDSAAQGYSDVYIETHGPDTVGSMVYGPHTLCHVDHYFIDDNADVGQMIGMYAASPYSVAGVVTHVNDFTLAGPFNSANYYYQWLNFIDSEVCQTMRQIIRQSGCSPTAISDKVSKNDLIFSLHPNPALDQFTIRLLDPSVAYEVEMLNTMGQIVFASKIKKELNIPVSWPAGLYHARVFDGLKSETSKLIIMD